VAEGTGTETAGRVVDVLLLFTEGPPVLGVSEVARRLGLSKAVVHRILRTLLGRGMVVVDQETRGYRIGPAVAALGARALRDSTLREVAVPVIRDLARRTGETTTLSQLLPSGRVYLDQVPSDKEIKQTVELGRRFPLHAGSSSKCMLAFLPRARREEVINGELPVLTDRTVVDRDKLRATLDRIRRQGYTWSTGERQVGAGSVAAPVFSVDGEVVGAMSICGPLPRFDAAVRQRCIPLIVAAADQVSRALGWRGGLPNEPGEPKGRAVS
jgi:IclR family transcriptional regulator, acetate operon repressor